MRGHWASFLNYSIIYNGHPSMSINRNYLILGSCNFHNGLGFLWVDALSCSPSKPCKYFWFFAVINSLAIKVLIHITLALVWHFFRINFPKWDYKANRYKSYQDLMTASKNIPQKRCARSFCIATASALLSTNIF